MDRICTTCGTPNISITTNRRRHVKHHSSFPVYFFLVNFYYLQYFLSPKGSFSFFKNNFWFMHIFITMKGVIQICRVYVSTKPLLFLSPKGDGYIPRDALKFTKSLYGRMHPKDALKFTKSLYGWMHPKDALKFTKSQGNGWVCLIPPRWKK